MACDFTTDGKSVTKGNIFMQGQTTIGAVEPSDADVPNCSIAFFVSGSNLKAKYKDAGGTVIVFTIDTDPPGFQPTP